MDFHTASRTAGLLFAILSNLLVWSPPKGGLVAKEDAIASKSTNDPQSPTGWEGRTSAAAWKTLFSCAILTQTGFQLWIFQKYSEGWTGFVKAPWTMGDGFALAAMGAAVWIRRSAYKQLGKYFTYKVHFVQDQPLVSDGVYRKLMHPSYTGLIIHTVNFLFFVGLKRDLRILAAYFAIGIVPLTGRMLSEEKGLEKHFGKEKFDEYRSTRWRLIPFIF